MVRRPINFDIDRHTRRRMAAVELYKEPLLIKKYLAYPAGAGGNFLTSLLMSKGKEKFKIDNDNNNEWHAYTPTKTNLRILGMSDGNLEPLNMLGDNAYTIYNPLNKHAIRRTVNLYKLARKKSLKVTEETDNRMWIGHMLPLNACENKIIKIEHCWIMMVDLDQLIWTFLLFKLKQEFKADFGRLLHYVMNTMCDDSEYSEIKNTMFNMQQIINPILKEHFPIVELGSIMHSHILRKGVEFHNGYGAIDWKEWIRDIIYHKLYHIIVPLFNEEGLIVTEGLDKRFKNVIDNDWFLDYTRKYDLRKFSEDYCKEVFPLNYADFFYSQKVEHTPWENVDKKVLRKYSNKNIQMMHELGKLLDYEINPDKKDNIGKYILSINAKFNERMKNSI